VSSLCVTGYGSLDYAVTLDGFAEGNRTTLVSRRDPAAWPRCGGCPAYVAHAVVATVAPTVISWMGDNTEGRLYCDGLRSAGIDVSGVALLETPGSPTALLVYQADGSCACLYDPAFDGRERLTAAQAERIAAASHLCVSVGPPHLMRPIVDARAPGARLYWLAKNDPAAFTPENRRLLSVRADVIFCNSAELALVDRDLSRATIIETRGRDGVVVHAGGAETAVPVEPVAAGDTTGAGDTFAGAYIAAEMDGIVDPVQAAERASEAARAFLLNRASEEQS